jgi:hypothetical protein
VRGILLALVVAAASLAAAPAASAQLLEPYDGSNPFDCTLQTVGFGVDFPDPGADPFCVEFDKTRQNITELGIVDFLVQEPARVAAAGLKCFYYQHDHWTSSIVQDNAATELYNWDGSYFFDKARGTGGVYIENFTLNNQTFDPRLIPGFPEEWKPYFGPGRGGVQAAASGVEFQPDCVQLAKRKSVYAKRAGGGGVAAGAVGCLTGHGSIARGVPGARLGSQRSRVLGMLGPPTRRSRGRLRWCTVGDGELVAAFGRSRLRLVLSTSPAYDLGGVASGDSAEDARRSLKGERTLRRGRRTALLGVRRRGRTLLVRLRTGRVHWVAARARRARA